MRCKRTEFKLLPIRRRRVYRGVCNLNNGIVGAGNVRGIGSTATKSPAAVPGSGDSGGGVHSGYNSRVLGSSDAAVRAPAPVRMRGVNRMCVGKVHSLAAVKLIVFTQFAARGRKTRDSALADHKHTGINKAIEWLHPCSDKGKPIDRFRR